MSLLPIVFTYTMIFIFHNSLVHFQEWKNSQYGLVGRHILNNCQIITGYINLSTSKHI